RIAVILAMTGRTDLMVGSRRHRHPLPAPLVKNRIALRTNRRFSQLALHPVSADLLFDQRSLMGHALHGLRNRNPARLICAVPVAPPDTLDKIAVLADEVVCLLAPADFRAVGQFYAEFPQVEDEEVMRILQAG